MKQHSKRYMLVLKTWGGPHKATASYDEYDTLEELKEGEKLAKALYKDTPKPIKSNDYWYYGRHNKMMSYTYPEGHYWWGYIMLDFEKQLILGTGGTSLYDDKSMQNLRIKDDYFRGDDEIPEGYVWHQGEYEGWLQYRWGDGKNALDYEPPKKQNKEEDTEIGIDIETEGLDNPFDDYKAELIQTQFQDLIDKEKLEKIKERW